MVVVHVHVHVGEVGRRKLIERLSDTCTRGRGRERGKKGGKCEEWGEQRVVSKGGERGGGGEGREREREKSSVS